MSDVQDGGWIATAILAGIGIFKGVWDYLKKRSDDSTKVKLHETDQYNLSKQDLTKQYTELLTKFDELELKFSETDKRLQKALDAFDIILPLIRKMIEEKPEYKEVIDRALKHLTTN